MLLRYNAEFVFFCLEKKYKKDLNFSPMIKTTYPFLLKLK